MRKTWRLQGVVNPLVIVRRSDLRKGEEVIRLPSLALNLDRWLADPLSRNVLLDLYGSLGGNLASSVSTTLSSR